jgi:hypothetical protein
MLVDNGRLANALVTIPLPATSRSRRIAARAPPSFGNR